MTRRLTAREVEAARAGKARAEISDGGSGLYLVVQPSGKRSWAVRYRFKSRPRKVTLGPYPALRLGDARDRADAIIRAVHEGCDPAAERITEKRREPAP